MAEIRTKDPSKINPAHYHRAFGMDNGYVMRQLLKHFTVYSYWQKSISKLFLTQVVKSGDEHLVWDKHIVYTLQTGKPINWQSLKKMFKKLS